MPHVEDPDPPRHFLRSSVKPRVLFPKATAEEYIGDNPNEDSDEQGEKFDDSEECPTDIEDEKTVFGHTEIEQPMTPRKTKETETPMTPPTVIHNTRSSSTKKVLDMNLHEETSPFATTKGKRISPFSGWQRTKTGANPDLAPSTRKKRAASQIQEGEAKRVRHTDF